MSLYRTYFTKNNTIVDNNKMNFGRNPVTEISYGIKNNVSRFIFDIDIEKLKDKIIKEGYSINNIKSHKLVLYNTISNNNNITSFFGDRITQRTSSFQLDLFKINESWNEGSGYKFMYQEFYKDEGTASGSNWFNKNSTDNWSVDGVFVNQNDIVNTFYSENGNEDINIDITDYINDIIFNESLHFGFGLKFSDEYENLLTKYRQAVAYHTRHTHTFFVPYLETEFDDNINEYRNNIIIGKENELYLSSKADITVEKVEIIDDNDSIIEIIEDPNIIKIKKGVYKVEYTPDSSADMVMYYDKWYYTDEKGNESTILQRFVLREDDIFIQKNKYIEFNNYHINISGIKSNEKISLNNKNRLVKLDIKKKYYDDVDLIIYYDLYIKLNNNNIIKVVDKQKTNNISNYYWFDLNLEYLIPQRYTIDIIISDGNYEYVTKSIDFDIIYETF